MRTPTIIFQTFLVLAVCWLMIEQACAFMRDRAQAQRQQAQRVDMLVTQGSIRRAL